ncbi:molybdopterin dinucleotide binding domain-containing protein [Chloroflexota bacterium]
MLGVAEGGMVQMVSYLGRVTAGARPTERAPQGVVFMAFHLAQSAADLLANPATGLLA